MLSTIDFHNPWLVAVGLNTVLLTVAWFAPKKLLTPAGLFHAWILGILIWGTLGWPGYVVVMFYFLVGSGVTRISLCHIPQLAAPYHSLARQPRLSVGSPPS